jgi:nanoRNase/pAp phosphatase (c-di-AMP/oligoRNAs hydrolase)
MNNDRKNIKRFFNQFKTYAKVLMVINADPDAIASTLAFKRLLGSRVSEVNITHFIRISPVDNLTLIQLVASGLMDLASVDNNRKDTGTAAQKFLAGWIMNQIEKTAKKIE